MHLKLETYTPAEAELITNVSQATVRNWRRAGHLESPKGHARYNIAELLLLFSMGMLVARGISPETARAISGPTARAIMQSALHNPSLYSNETRAMAVTAVADIDPDEVSKLREIAGEEIEFEEVKRALELQELTTQGKKFFGFDTDEDGTWLVVWADGTQEFLQDGKEDFQFFSEIEFQQPYAQGPVVLFCLGALAHMVVDRLPRPAICLVEEDQ